MNRLDKIKGGTAGDIAEMLCDLIQDTLWDAETMGHEKGWRIPHQCMVCPGRRTCKIGHNGFLDWLKEAAEE